ncbi:unnamed protein product [Cuscuta epithymum]|uniref:Uncharacterized protein n=1 Tax=Cuscuta epithymum TaxID=186058 RepID=A0AAV0ERU7_9ASTE|nr:unnamed protein product [Cuscuta epithymum]
MGCTSSKLDDLPAVSLCRDRCSFLDETIHQRFAMAEAHVAYVHSLQSVGASLHRLFSLDLDDHSSPAAADDDDDGPTSPVHKAGKKQHAADVYHHHSSSGSHLCIHSDSDEDEDSSHSPSLHHQSESPPPGHSYEDPSTPYTHSPQASTSGTFTHMNFMRNQSTPSVTYQQRPMSADTVRMDDLSSSYYPYYNPNPNPNPNSSPNQSFFSYATTAAASFFGSSQPGRSSSSTSQPGYQAWGPSSAPSTSKQAPPPPPPPTGSAWDFLNPFESFDNFHRPFSPSRNSKDVREEEGIPELEEDDDSEHEVVKKVQVDHNFMGGGGGRRPGGNKSEKAAASSKKKNDKPSDSESVYRGARPNLSDPVEYEVHVVDKKVVKEEGTSENRDSAREGFKARGRFNGDSDVMSEIQVQFQRASESGSEMSKILEVGKLPYNRKHAAYQASYKMLHAFTPSLSVLSSKPSTSDGAEGDISDPALLDVEGEVSSLRPRSLSSTLQKLYLWEKKLYEEVKVEEKMRVLHERKSLRLKQLSEKGAETQKVDVTRTLVRSLSTKIRIAIQIVDKISEKISKLRDEELWPQLNDFIHGLSRMWKSMLECHQIQYHAIMEAKRLDSIALNKQFSDAHLEATLHLEHDLLNWTLRFSCWVSAQRGYIRALNNWLMKCLLYVPEETDDGPVPFSPGRIGAPPVFVICNHWAQSFERVSEQEVIDSMRDFATNILHLWEKDKLQMRNRMMDNKKMEKKIKNLEREDQKIHREMQALEKRILVSAEENTLSLNTRAIYQSETSKNSSLQAGLQHIFEAMERFTASCLKVYEELLQRIEEDNLARHHDRVS